MRVIRKVWIAGADGRIGKQLYALLDKVEYEIFDTDVESVDLTKMEEVKDFCDRNRPDVVINCAGFSNIEKCENNVEEAFLVNALGERNLSVAARNVGARHVLISTDMVYPRNLEKIVNEYDEVHPQNVFGQTKAAAENYAKDLAQKFYIIRTGWIYGTKNDFISKLLELAKTKDTICVSKEAFATPTSPREIAKFILQLIDTANYGIYNCSCQGICSAAEFAAEVIKLAGLKTKIIPVEDSKCELQDFYGSNVKMDNFVMRISGMEPLKEWKEALAEYMNYVK